MATRKPVLELEGTVETKTPRKRKAGGRRVTVNLTEEEYQELLLVSANEMREPNNMLGYRLRGKVKQLLHGELVNAIIPK